MCVRLMSSSSSSSSSTPPDAAAWLCCLQTVAHPDDSEAWRLLGESRLLNADATKSVSAYQQAIALDPKDQQIITVSIRQRAPSAHTACADRLHMYRLHTYIFT
jgi:predicted TPR repeat methyltransferase